MQGKVTLEDHFAIEATLGDSQPFGAHVWPELRHRLLDFQDQRLRLMDEAGVEIMIASLNAPAIQGIADIKRAIELAREANDVLAQEVAKRPDRFVGVAALPMQDPEHRDRGAATLRSRSSASRARWSTAISQVAGSDKPIHYDLPQYRPFWRAVERLDVPFYLHPRPPMPGISPPYEGHHWLFGPTWSFAAETVAACHAADRQRPVRRVSAAADHSRPSRRGAAVLPLAHRQPKQLDEGAAQIRGAQARGGLFPRQFPSHHLGHFSTPALIDAMAEIGADRVMFSVDYPFEDFGDAADWFDHAEIGETDRRKIGRTNAMKLFKLGA